MNRNIQPFFAEEKKSDIRAARSGKQQNALYLANKQGIPLAMSSLKSGEHHDVNDIEKVIGGMFENLEKSNIRIDAFSSMPMQTSVVMHCETYYGRKKSSQISVSTNERTTPMASL